MFTASNMSASESMPDRPVKNALKLTNKKDKSKVWYVLQNQKVKFWIEGKKYKGRLDSISENSLYVNGKSYEISKISRIKAKMSDGKGFVIAGAIIGGFGIISAIASLSMFVMTASNSGGYDSLGYAVGGLFFLLITVVLLPIGIYLFVIGRRKVKNTAEWKIDAVNISKQN